MGFFFGDPHKKYEGLDGKWDKEHLLQYCKEFGKAKIRGGLSNKALYDSLSEALDLIFSSSAGEPEKALKAFLVQHGWNLTATYARKELPDDTNDKSSSTGAQFENSDWQKPVDADNILHLGIRASSLAILQTILRLPKSTAVLDHKNGEGRTPVELACTVAQEQFSIAVSYEILSGLSSAIHAKKQKEFCELALNIYTCRLIPEGVEMVFKVTDYKQLNVISYHVLHVERVKAVGGLLVVRKTEDDKYENLMNEKNKTGKRSNSESFLKENYLIQELMRDETTDKTVVQKIFTYYIQAMNSPSLRLKQTYQIIRQAIRENNKIVLDSAYNNVETVDVNTTLLLHENLSSLMLACLFAEDHPAITWDLIDFLIMSGAIMNFPDGRGDTSLHIISRKCFKLQQQLRDKSFIDTENVDLNGDGVLDADEESVTAKLARLKLIRDRLIIRHASLVLENADGETPIKILTRSMSREEFFNIVRVAYSGDVHALSFRFILLKNIPAKFRQIKKLLKDQVNETNPKMGNSQHHRGTSNDSRASFALSRSSVGHGSSNSMTSRDSFVLPKDSGKKPRGKPFSIKYDFEGRYFPVSSDNRATLDSELKEAHEHPIEKCFLNFFFPLSNIKRIAWFYLFQNFDPIGFLFVLIIFLLSMVASICFIASGIGLAVWSLVYALTLMFSTVFFNLFYYLLKACSCKCNWNTLKNCCACFWKCCCCCCIWVFDCCCSKKGEEEKKEDDLIIEDGVEMTDSLRQSYKAYGNIGLGAHKTDCKSIAYLGHEFQDVYASPEGLPMAIDEPLGVDYEAAEETSWTSLQHSSMNPVYIFSQWRSSISGIVTKMKDSRRSNVSCILKEVQIKNVAFAGENGILNGFLEEDGPVKLFLDPAVRAVIDYKWRKWAYTIHVIEMLLHIVNIASFTTYVYELHDPTNPYFESSRFDYNDYMTLANRSAMLTFLLLLRNMRYEVIDIFNTPFIAWVTNIFNVIDTAKFLVFGAILWSEDQTLTTRLLSIEAILLWSKMLHFMKGFKATGALITMIVATAAEVGAFLLLLVFIFASFASAFYSMFRTSGLEAWSTPFLVFLNLLGVLMGEVPGEDVYDSDEQILSTVILLLFMVIVVIIMLNLLISIVSKVFEITYEEKDANFSRGKGEIIDEIESAYNINKRNRTWFPEKLYLVTKVDDRPDDNLEYDEALDSANSPRRNIPSINLSSGLEGLLGGKTLLNSVQEESKGVETENPISGIQTSESDVVLDDPVEIDNDNVRRDQINADKRETEIFQKVEKEDVDVGLDLVDIMVDDDDDTGNNKDGSNLMEAVINQRRASLASTATNKTLDSEKLDLDEDIDDDDGSISDEKDELDDSRNDANEY